MDAASIAKRIEMLETAEAEYKTKKEMLDDALRSDSELQEKEDKLKEYKKEVSIQKEIILNEPSNKKMVEDLKDMALEIKDTKKLLGDELIAYFMENNTLEYVTPSGDKKRILISAKFARGKEEA